MLLIGRARDEAEVSCDHSRPGASRSLVELRDLEGDVHQGGQHHLRRNEHRGSDFIQSTLINSIYLLIVTAVR